MATDIPGVVIRPAEKTDCAELARLIKDLAEYEGHRDHAKLTKEELEEDGFGEDRWFYGFVAEDPNAVRSETDPPRLIGYVVYFMIYYSYEGRAVYMRDLYVSSEFRKKGIGKTLMKKVAQVGVDNNCVAMFFICLKHNTPSLAFYKRQGAEDLAETEALRNLILNRNDLEKLASS
ncbi:diamine acetyltransferase 1-like [Liolophura sinensis]|uniref:diamine acetyltransferase 1-like n=1 Tax=Liolophura sinensis TaxID=3198878 RepID=UPI003159752A